MKTDTLFGKTINVVGNVSADLVLECLGNIYIKSRNKAQTLDEIIKSLMSDSGESIVDRTIITDDIEELSNINNGQFIYDTNSNILYLQVGDELVELINVSTVDTRYVKRTGDTMTGVLTINTPAGVPPLKVNSTSLNKNLNSQFLNGLSSDDFAQKNKNEIIKGSWTFNDKTVFNDPAYFYQNTIHYRDSLHQGSVGTPEFASGFGGYGWRIDAETNTLTIDYLVVRKAMYVYELVVNKITATNGSLWVSNASKVEHAYQLKIIVDNGSNIWNAINPRETTDTSNLDIKQAIYELGNDDGVIVTQSLPTDNFTGKQMSSNIANGQAKTDYRFKGLKVVTCENKENIASLLEDVSNSGRTFTFSNNDFQYDNVTFAFRQFDLFDPYFDSDVVFPIIHTNKWYEKGQSRGEIKYIKTYHKYFGQTYNGNNSHVFLTNLFLVKFEDLAVFQPGDILRCQKLTGNGIKYYDAVVCNKLRDAQYVIQLGENVMDKTTTITYNNNLDPTTTVQSNPNNKDLYATDGHRSNDILGTIQEGDNIVQIGHLWDVTRQNAVYLTSSDDGSPFIDTMSQVNRPDYSVIYNVPTFVTKLFYRGSALPFTGNYYIQNTSDAYGVRTAQYAVAYKEAQSELDNATTYSIALNKVPTKVTLWYKLDGNIYKVDYDSLYNGSYTQVQIKNILDNQIRLQEEPIYDQGLINQNLDSVLDVKWQIARTYGLSTSYLDDFEIYVLRGYPNEYTLLVTDYEVEDLLFENGEVISLENNDTIILEEVKSNHTISPTKTIKARLGNLDGIIDSSFSIDKQPHGFGLYSENVFLTGEFILSSGKNVADFNKDFLYLQSGLEQNSMAYADLQKALQRLSDNTPGYGNLESAGIFLTPNGKLIIYGDSIQIITKLEEFNPNDPDSSNELPTALFADGKIKAKFLEIQELHSIESYYDNQDTPDIRITYEWVFYNETYYVGANQMYFYYPITYEGRVNNKPQYKKQNELRFIRKYTNTNSNFMWAFCDIDGKCIKDAYNVPQFVYYKELSEGNYGNIAPGFNNSSGQTGEAIDKIYNEFCDYIKDNYFRRWSLHENGVGNLGGKSIYWDEEGKVTVSGKLISSEGQIGGFYIGEKSLYVKEQSIITTIEENQYTIKSHRPIEISTQADQYDASPQIQLYDEYFYNNSYRVRSRACIRPDSITIDDGVQGETSRVQLSTSGIVWKKDGFTLGAAAVILNLIVIPIDTGSGYQFFVSSSGSQATTRFGVVSASINSYEIYWNSDGYFLIYFYELDSENGGTLSSWIAQNIALGKITFILTGTNMGYGSSSSFNQGDATHRQLVKPSMDQIAFASGSYKFGSSQSIGNEDYNYTCSSGGSGSFTSPGTISNYLFISTADDATANPGGIMLTMLYNNF